jgi:hypothetical protein
MLIPLLILFLALCFKGCKSPEDPDEPLGYNYEEKLEVFYYRDITRITSSDGTEKITFFYELFDPDPKIRSDNDQEVVNDYRYGNLEMEKIEDNKFRSYLEQVFINKTENDKPHIVCIQDPAIADEDDQTTQYSGENITIQTACRFEVIPYSPGSSGTKLKFWLSEGG